MFSSWFWINRPVPNRNGTARPHFVSPSHSEAGWVSDSAVPFLCWRRGPRRGRANSFIRDLKQVLGGLFSGLSAQQICVAASVLCYLSSSFSRSVFRSRWTDLRAAFTSVAAFLFLFFFWPEPPFSPADWGQAHVWVWALLVWAIWGETLRANSTKNKG